MTAAFIFTKMQFSFISSSLIRRHDKLVSFLCTMTQSTKQMSDDLTVGIDSAI